MKTIITFILLLGIMDAQAGNVIWQEAESFHSTGKWSNDPQHIDIMGSPYLLATGLGTAVADAVTNVSVKESGPYVLWVRCRDWLPSHSPGQFEVLVNGKSSRVRFGKAETDSWQWINGGEFELKKGDVELRLRDTTGWWGRCDAIVLATGSFTPSNEKKALAQQRLKYAGVSPAIKDMGKYELVVVGGGPAGIGTSVAAARNGLKVALIQDRPVLGGNASSEIEIPPKGYNGKPMDLISITGIAKEIFGIYKRGPSTAEPAKLLSIVTNESNISLFLNTRGTGVEMADDHTIKSVIAQNVHSGQRMRFSASLFADTTGHGWIGYYAGAEYMVGQEARSEFGESLAPDKASKLTMGNSLYKAVFKSQDKEVPFICPEWAYQWKDSNDFEPKGSHKRIDELVRPENFDPPARGKGRNPRNNISGTVSHAWWVEYGGMEDTIEDAEHIRDELFRISLGLWNYAKNHNPNTVNKNKHRELVWLNYVPGVRESRRLVGDYILSQKDLDDKVVHDDHVAFCDWGVDLHHPQGFWVKGNDCIAVYKDHRKSIPYRTLYSKNINNLFMAGRNHSATQIAMAATRVMHPCAAMGQAVGTAAAIAVKHQTSPRGVYQHHIAELQDTLIKDGCRLMNKDRTMREPAKIGKD